MVGVGLTFLRTSLGTGADTQTIVNLPIDLHVTVDPIHKRLSLKRPLSLPWNLVNHHFRPYTFVTPYDLKGDVTRVTAVLSQPHDPLYGVSSTTAANACATTCVVVAPPRMRPTLTADHHH